MTIHLKPRRRGSYWIFALRTLLLLSVILLPINFGFLMAQGIVNTSDLLRNVVGGSDYLVQTDLFIYIRGSAVIPSFGIALLVFMGMSLGHFVIFGPKDMSLQENDETISWWNLFERIVHWIIAVVFVILFISGLLITFGRYIGGGSGTLFMRQIHDYAGFVFIPALVVTTLMWIREGLPKVYDLSWLTHAGGYLGYKGHLKSGKFNAGQKQWYWVMVIFGALLAWSGLGMFFQWGMMSELRLYVVIHFISAVIINLWFMIHLYMTTYGTKGTLRGMINGHISKKAAETFHSEAPELGS